MSQRYIFTFHICCVWYLAASYNIRTMSDQPNGKGMKKVNYYIHPVLWATTLSFCAGLLVACQSSLALIWRPC